MACRDASMGAFVKLSRVTNTDPIIRQSWGVHQSVVDMLRAYQDLYKDTHGDEIPMNQLVEEMCKNFMDSDKDFQKFFRNWQIKNGGAQSPALGEES